MMAAWACLLVFALVSVPLKYPFEATGQVTDSGVIVGLALPVLAMSGLLAEGPAHLVACAQRSLVMPRSGSVVALLALTCVGAGMVGLLSRVPTSTLLNAALLVCALQVLGAGALGLRVGWTLPLGTVLVFSAPGLVPWRYNLFYRTPPEPWMQLVALALMLVAAAMYVRFGSYGVRLGEAARRSHEHHEE